MRRWQRVLLTIVAALALLLSLNAIVLDRQTKSAEVNVEGGEIVRLPGGDLQVLDTGSGAKSPIVLLNCFTCSINWWDEVIPKLQRAGHRVIAIDLLGHGGSEKPTSGYEISAQAQLVAQALGQLDVEQAVVVGHSLGGAVAVGLTEEAPQLVGGVAILDTEPDTSYGKLSLSARATTTPVIGEGLWRVKMDWSISRGLEEAFAPGFEVPDQFVEDLKLMTYKSYDESHSAFDDYVSESPLDQRLGGLGKPLMVLFGAEEQIVEDPREALSAYAAVDGAQTALVKGSGHSPNVEKPVETARLILRFAGTVAAGEKGADPGQTPTASGPPPSPNRPCDRPSRSGQGSGAPPDGEQGSPGSLPARCRNESSSTSPQPQGEPQTDPDPQAPGPSPASPAL